METIGTENAAEAVTARTTAGGGPKPVGRVIVLLVLLLAAMVALRGQMPGARAPRDPSAGDSPASFAAMVALLGVAMVVMAFAVFSKRPALPKVDPTEIRDFSGGGPGINKLRLVLIVLGFVLLWLAIFVVLSQFQIDNDFDAQNTAPTTVADAPNPGPQRAATKAPEADKDTYRLLVLATLGMLVMMVIATVLTAVRNRSSLPPVALVGTPEEDGTPTDQPLAVAAERGLAEVANPALEPREAIIACYAAMEKALAEAPGAAPLASDTPSEVLARAVGNRTVRADSASTLVELFAEARFSGHVMTEDHRTVAEQALRAVLAELRSAG